MGNRKSRELMKQQDDYAAWTVATTQPRLAVSDVHARGIGTRRLQLIVGPSFTEGMAWEVRQFENRWHLYRSDVLSDRPLHLLGYARLSIESGILESFFNRIVSLTLPIMPTLNGMAGADGESFQLAIFGDMWSEVRFQWWSEPPQAWMPLVAIAAEMIRAFKAAPAAS